jgi:hypothetical protein
LFTENLQRYPSTKFWEFNSIKVYIILAPPPPVPLYGSETWSIKAREARKITAAEMKYMRRTAGYIWTD